MKVLVLLTLLFSFATVPAIAHSNTQSDSFKVLKAKKYGARKSRYFLNVSVPADKLNSEFTLTIQNGKNIKLKDCSKVRHPWHRNLCNRLNSWKTRLQAYSRVNSGYVLINGQTVVSPATLNKNVDELEVKVTLEQLNRLEIQLHGNCHSFITLKIDGKPISNIAPVASFETSNEENQFLVGQTVAFDASSSSDADGTIVEYQWDFGDGTTEVSATPAISHTYSAAGDYVVTLVVIDDQNAESVPAEADLNVREPAPLIAEFETTPENLQGPAPLTINAVNTTSNVDAEIVSVEWSTSNGETGTGDNFSTTFSVPGNYTITMTVTDSLGRTASKTVDVTVTFF